jgi:dTDP-glucose 4,6-dehydratase
MIGTPLPQALQRILVIGGAGFIGGAMVRRLLSDSQATVFNLDKIGYASDLTGIERLGAGAAERHQLLQVDLADGESTAAAIKTADPDLVLHLAAESHVDRSIDGPGAFIESNVTGTFHLLQAVRSHWEGLPAERQAGFRLHHISTDEMFGSLGATGLFSESTPSAPRSTFSASKAASDQLVNAWHHTYGLPVVILKAAASEPIQPYGDGSNVRDWMYVDNHVDALLVAATQGQFGHSYCVGGHGERSNKYVVEAICALPDERFPGGSHHRSLITPVRDRPGHDRRYAINPDQISEELGWQSRHNFEEGLGATVDWYLANIDWCAAVRQWAGYGGEQKGSALAETAASSPS